MTEEVEKTPVQGEARRGGVRKLVGILLAVMGFFWLAHKAGWMPADHGHPAIFWPIVVIAIGLFMFFSTRHNRTA